MLALGLGLLLAAATPDPASLGANLYQTSCATCHGATMDGSANAPSLHGVGMAALDFYLTTGRMPAAVPWLQVSHRGAQLGDGEIAAIEHYLAPTVGDPQIPMVIANGNLVHGRELYDLNCQQCHASEGGGGALGGLDWVPSLHKATITQVAEAVRVGPGEMPQFGEHQLSQSDLNDVASYVMTFRTDQTAGAPPFRSTGPIPEGAIGWMTVIVLVIFVFSFWRGDTPPSHRTDAVRPEAPAEEPRSS